MATGTTGTIAMREAATGTGMSATVADMVADTVVGMATEMATATAIIERRQV